ncbi:DUF1642 domain-containing protein [Lactiplantibacillus plantarum]|uniref:DUF1642 domain-containing protein n=1 Tax=Lactiplantibacillus plantarum TaxID=1590 RepID=UPI0020A5EFFC|nr:DUF1642 domain-containing protein [Lactiplantibacillus plantarum]MCG0783508.1 hypothetical protein [Lactiplantibacillus plantarum]UTD39959.1 hypothetical protein H5V40_10645 [Lactiplantibacillus plantarum]
MKNETKRDVFDDALTYVPVGNEYDPANDDEAGDLRSFLSARYAAALPDDLPVIPKSWADTIEEYKANHYRLEKIFTDALILNYDEQDVVARAWLDGYVVEEGKWLTPNTPKQSK